MIDRTLRQTSQYTLIVIVIIMSLSRCYLHLDLALDSPAVLENRLENLNHQRREAEEESEPKRQKIRKSKIDNWKSILGRTLSNTCEDVSGYADMHKLSCKKTPDYHRLVSRIEKNLLYISSY